MCQNKMWELKMSANMTVNVDALDLDELRELSKSNSGYSLYAKLAVKAREARLAGDVNRALTCEALLDKYYNDLPEHLQW